MASAPLTAPQLKPWLTTEEYLVTAGISRRSFFYQKPNLTTRKEGGKLFIASTSLPEEVLARLTPPAPSTAIVRTPKAEPELPLFARAEIAPQATRRIALQEGQRELAERKYAIVKQLIDYIEDRTFRAACQATLGVRNAEQMAAHLAATAPGELKVSRPTLWRWKKQYEQHGLAGLGRKVREDKGRSKWAQAWPAAAKLVVATYTQSAQTKQTAYDALVRDRAMLGIPEAELPSYAAVCDFLSSLPKAAVVLAREGERAHAAQFATYLRRGYTDIRPNQVWVSDHCIHDVFVRNDCFFGIGEDEPMRLRLTALMDLRSRMIVGYTWTPEGSSRSITTVLRDAVKRFGPCETFYCDNGKDFQKVGKFAAAANQAAHVDEDMEQIERAGTLRMLGIRVQYCIKYHPQSKPIERLFRTMHLGLDAILPHYTTGSTATLPERAAEDHAATRKLIRMDRGHLSPLLPASRFIGMATEWIENDYNRRHKHRGQGMNGRTPWEVFESGWAQHERREIDASILDTLLWKRERRCVRNCAITVANRRLIGVTPYDVERLYRLTKNSDGGNEVLVCYDPNAPETAVITDFDGHKICDVQAEELVAHSAAANPMIEASLQERRSLRNDTAASLRALRHDVARAGHKTAAQDLYERSALPMAVGEVITQRASAPSRPRPAAEAPKYAFEIAASVLQED